MRKIVNIYFSQLRCVAIIIPKRTINHITRAMWTAVSALLGLICATIIEAPCHVIVPWSGTKIKLRRCHAQFQFIILFYRVGSV